VHKLVRTHPVTGWKSTNCGGYHNIKINDIPGEESNEILAKFRTLVSQNHDLQARVRWENPHDLVIWDNRAVYHTATLDVEGKRLGYRVLSTGEIPFLDSESKGRARSLMEEAEAENKLKDGAASKVEANASIASPNGHAADQEKILLKETATAS